MRPLKLSMTPITVGDGVTIDMSILEAQTVYLFPCSTQRNIRHAQKAQTER